MPFVNTAERTKSLPVWGAHRRCRPRSVPVPVVGVFWRGSQPVQGVHRRGHRVAHGAEHDDAKRHATLDDAPGMPSRLPSDRQDTRRCPSSGVLYPACEGQGASPRRRSRSGAGMRWRQWRRRFGRHAERPPMGRHASADGVEVARRISARGSGCSPDLDSRSCGRPLPGLAPPSGSIRSTSRSREPLRFAGMRGDYRGENLKIFG